ncbi:MAG: polymer-forming cytoskeletal protein [Cytophagales bacterium]|nr:polymer-forming cytoskeletal protein [Cytophagales bacterium]
MLKSKKEADSAASKSNHLEKGTLVEGNIKTSGNMRLDCDVKGDISVAAKLVLGPSANIVGNINSKNLEISGEVTGDVTVTELLVLHPSTIITGNITTPKLITEQGATINGTVTMENAKPEKSGKK